MQFNTMYCDTIQESAVQYDTTKFSDAEGTLHELSCEFYTVKFTTITIIATIIFINVSINITIDMNVNNNTIYSNIINHTASDITVY